MAHPISSVAKKKAMPGQKPGFVNSIKNQNQGFRTISCPMNVADDRTLPFRHAPPRGLETVTDSRARESTDQNRKSRTGSAFERFNRSRFRRKSASSGLPGTATDLGIFETITMEKTPAPAVQFQLVWAKSGDMFWPAQVKLF